MYVSLSGVANLERKDFEIIAHMFDAIYTARQELEATGDDQKYAVNWDKAIEAATEEAEENR